MNMLKTAIAAIVVAAGTLGAALPAAAESPRWGHGSTWHGDRHDRWDRHDRHDRHDRWGRRGVCEPHEAVGKASAFGVRRAGIARVSRHEIVVMGRYRGNHALIVFDRSSRNCRVVAARGI